MNETASQDSVEPERPARGAACPRPTSGLWRRCARFRRADWLRFETRLALWSAVLVYAVATRYLPFVGVTEGHAVLYLALAWLSHFGLLVALVTLPQLALALLAPTRWVLVPLGVAAFAALLAALLVDTEIYTRYRFHVNGFVWELLSGPGTGENLTLSTATLLALAAAAALVLAVSSLAVQLALHGAADDRRRGIRARYGMAAWAFALIIAQGMHVWYEAHYDREVTGVTRHFPLYHPLTAKRLLARHGWFDPSTARERGLSGRTDTDGDLAYPASPMRCVPPPDPPNVLIVIVDALRADAFERRVMPRLHALSERPDAQLFTDHVSGGNVTRGGIFALFSGLPATYWDAFAAAHRGAVWIEEHQRAGYRVGIFSSATLMSPAFDRTVFASVSGLRLGSDGEDPIARDLDAVADFLDFLAVDDDRPFFGVLYLDAAHGPSVPVGAEHFRPQWERVDHLLLDADFDPLPYVNRYRNALHWLDGRVADLLERADADGHLERTLVILTSDHGDEFNDLGLNYWGHGSNFSRYQTQVPLLMLWPDRARRRVDYRTTHYDVAPTVMRHVLGCENPDSDHSIGADLFDGTIARDRIPVVSYHNYGILLEDRVIATYPSGTYEVLGPDARALPDQRVPVAIRADVLDMLSRFYR